jgi:DNA replication and repair protein RecF
MRTLSLTSLSVRGFRNLAKLDLSFGPSLNVLSGDNGQGKTNLLEAIYALATSKSFRANKPGEIVAHGQETASLRGVLRDGDQSREQSVGLRHGGRVVRVDGKRPATLAEYAVLSPAVVFHPGELTLSMGSGSERRRLLDRVALYLRPGSLGALDAYARAMRARQKTLETRGRDAPELEAWEELMARHAVEVMASRDEGAKPLAEAAASAFSRIGAPGLVLRVEYVPSASRDVEELRARLRDLRDRDLHRGGASVGPHRDDLKLTLGEHPMRGVASQGQHRAVVLALKIAEIDVIAEARGVGPLLLLDDVSSELDHARTSALFSFLFERKGQIFLTTTRRELIVSGSIREGDRVDFRVEAGHVSPLSD